MEKWVKQKIQLNRKNKMFKQKNWLNRKIGVMENLVN